MDYHFGQFTPEHLPKIRKGIECFNKRHYWECHEVLEDAWLEDQGDNARLVYWVIIQVAVALYHYEDRNLEGMTGMINKAKEKIILAESKNVITDIVYQYLSWNNFKSLIMEIPEKDLKLSDFTNLYNFQFKDFSC